MQRLTHLHVALVLLQTAFPNVFVCTWAHVELLMFWMNEWTCCDLLDLSVYYMASLICFVDIPNVNVSFNSVMLGYITSGSVSDDGEMRSQQMWFHLRFILELIKLWDFNVGNKYSVRAVEWCLFHTDAHLQLLIVDGDILQFKVNSYSQTILGS